MALDEPTKSDSQFEFEGFKFIVNKDFLEKAKPIKIDFIENSFKLDCDMNFNSGCSSCQTNSSCST